MLVAKNFQSLVVYTCFKQVWTICVQNASNCLESCLCSIPSVVTLLLTKIGFIFLEKTIFYWAFKNWSGWKDMHHFKGCPDTSVGSWHNISVLWSIRRPKPVYVRGLLFCAESENSSSQISIFPLHVLL